MSLGLGWLVFTGWVHWSRSWVQSVGIKTMDILPNPSSCATVCSNNFDGDIFEEEGECNEHDKISKFDNQALRWRKHNVR